MNARTDDGHLSRVNQLSKNRGLQGATKLGRYVLDTFFDGSPERCDIVSFKARDAFKCNKLLDQKTCLSKGCKWYENQAAK